MSISIQPGAAVVQGGGGPAVATPTGIRLSEKGPPPEGDQGNRIADPADAAGRRLVIEQDKPSGAFVYKTVDRISGDILFQYPREQMLKLSQDPGYVAGAVVSTTA